MKSAVLAAFTMTNSTVAQTEDIHLGQIEYEIACMSCHGVDGLGDGPAARDLISRPTDLTQITRRNSGTFSDGKLARIIDGRAVVEGHGQREMPIWGARYRVATEDGEDNVVIEERARQRIAALVAYLRKIQASDEKK